MPKIYSFKLHEKSAFNRSDVMDHVKRMKENGKPGKDIAAELNRLGVIMWSRSNPDGRACTFGDVCEIYHVSIGVKSPRNPRGPVKKSKQKKSGLTKMAIIRKISASNLDEEIQDYLVKILMKDWDNADK